LVIAIDGAGLEAFVRAAWAALAEVPAGDLLN
jgi:hypothetical protein